MPSFAEEVAADSPTFWARMSESSGTALIDHMGGASGTYNGGYTLGVDGPLLDGSTAVTFDGVAGSVATVADRDELGTGDLFTVELYFKRDTITGALMKMISKGNNGYYIGLNSSGVEVAKRGAAVIATSTTTVPTAGSWYHVVWVKNGPENFIYINGVDRTGTVSNLTIENTTTQLSIGSSSISSSEAFAGTIDEAIVYNGSALSAARVLAHYNGLAVAPSVISDTFETRTAWGDANSGGTYALTLGAGVTASVSGGKGRFSLPATKDATANLPVAIATHDPLYLEWGFDSLPANNDHYLDVTARRVDSNNLYFVEVRVRQSNPIPLIAIYRRVGGVTTTLATEVSTGYSYLAGERYGLKFRLVGNVIEAKTWPLTSTEPAYQRSATDTSHATGSVEVYVYAGATTGGPYEVSLDNLSSGVPIVPAALATTLDPAGASGVFGI